ncbi:S-adenosyl-methyltransferase [Babesia ovis]|uniref:S-adenosyl-methyltransferase n=1 Tax=Babesia ovis TaxID=5869 RepID=A0A9W5TBX5_BABOV|nr:S-adenosyl-methyltransferase [Babesia ovis]
MVASDHWRRQMRATSVWVFYLASFQLTSAYVVPQGIQRILNRLPVQCVTLYTSGRQQRNHELSASASGSDIDSDSDDDVEDQGLYSRTTTRCEDSTGSYLPHEPVMLKESLEMLVTDPDGRYLDLTLGYGGHAEAILQLLSPKGSLVALDRDPEAVYHTSQRLGAYVSSGQLIPVIGTFRNLQRVLESQSLPLEGYTGIIADLGVSSHQLDSSKRGFAYNSDGPLDMRMSNPQHDPFHAGDGIDRTSSLETGNTAYKLVNRSREQDLASILREYGEEPRAAIIARRIIERRQRLGQIATTFELRDTILSCVRGNHKAGMKTLSRVFQALRIYVNDELDELQSLMDYAPSLLHRKNGRFAVIAYHSLEDRIVKHAFSALQSSSEMTPDKGTYSVLTKKCVTPTAEESRRNQKARSAKLRCLQRCQNK